MSFIISSVPCTILARSSTRYALRVPLLFRPLTSRGFHAKVKILQKKKFHEPSKPIRAEAVSTPPSRNSGKSLLLVASLAIVTTIASFLYQKDEPQEFIEEEIKMSQTPEFTTEQVKVIFVLGGPGAGKGTQCAKLVADHDFVHLSAGDLLRAEQAREGSEVGALIKHYITEGLIVPQEITIQLLNTAIKENYSKGRQNFLIDGFPRKMDQAITFEEIVVPSRFVLFFDCPESVMLERLLERGKTSGRDDDNAESIKKRFKTFEETSMPVVEYFAKQDKVVKIVCDKSVNEVYAEVETAIEKRL
ncbi:similar to Saccharomyces cerevisiae YKL024C URA6 Uridylate kinase [Maudiozyma saulgeensis]|uniref:Uridylate kinase n=1 Tax=Maudiozyma saulgeensis TaxID=1789683 RepID=A0A1X7QWV5_9SACH|nr:similar to Saccharomyces cerevisiae YKL024C URA6 Uridylate kinase [Kazachstania saulgeensis]